VSVSQPMRCGCNCTCWPTIWRDDAAPAADEDRCRIVRHGRSSSSKMAQVAVPRALFQTILGAIAAPLRWSDADDRAPLNRVFYSRHASSDGLPVRISARAAPRLGCR
jgi:hypothetical protein